MCHATSASVRASSSWCVRTCGLLVDAYKTGHDSLAICRPLTPLEAVCSQYTCGTGHLKDCDGPSNVSIVYMVEAQTLATRLHVLCAHLCLRT